MAFGKIEAASLKPGKTVALKLNQLPGSPVVHVEHLGETNASWWNDNVTKADPKAAAPDRAGKATLKSIAAARAANRIIVAKHAVRRLEATHDDGRKATDEDIPEFVESLPDHVFDIVKNFALDANNFMDVAADSDANELAGK